MKNTFKSKIRATFLLLGFITSVSAVLRAQVTVAGSTGANGVYTNLKSAFDALNANITQTGNTITISITGNTTETATAVLNQPLGGNWASLTISPSGGNAVTVSGALAAPLIGFAGADNVTIDGINNGGNSLTISNTSTGNSNVSTIVFYADATNNTITNTTIQGSGTATNIATIAFAAGLVTGNDNNTISNCTITSAGSNTPYNAIGSAGTSTAVDNSGITISNNNIQDYFAADSASTGIFISSNSSGWTITGNRFFQTSPRTATSGQTHRAIRIVTASGGGYNISNNIIGFGASNGSGLTIYNGTVASRFLGIQLTASNTVLSTIQGNKVGGIFLNTSSGATTAPGIFSGISVLAGKVTITGNSIGDATSSGSLSIISTTSLAYISGISVTSTDTVTIQNDTIGSFITGGTASIGYTFFGINAAGTGGHYTISNNFIGSASTTHSIAVGTSGTTTTGVCKFTGIGNSATGVISITNNTIQNCSAFGTAASNFNGINNTAGTGTLAITNNSIITGTSSGTGAFTAISNSANVATANINNNVIRNNVVQSTSASFNGIKNTGIVTTAINIKDNQLGNSNGGVVNYTAANTGTFNGIFNDDGDDNAQLTITGNDIRGISNAVAASSYHYYITNSTFAGSANISNNTFTNLSVNTSGDITFILNDVTHNAGSLQAIKNNAVVNGYINVGSGGTVYFYDAYSLSPTTVTEVDSANNFSNLTFTGATDIGGWRSSDGSFSGGPHKKVVDNVFRNIVTGSGTVTVLNVGYSDDNYTANNISGNIIRGISSSSDITGFTSASGTQNFFNNHVDSILCTGLGIVTGIEITGGATQNVYKNKLFSLVNTDANGIIDGVSIVGGTTVNVHNNLIGDLRTPASGDTDAIRGLSIVSTTSNSAINVYYNTVYLNAASTGTNFGTTGIYHAASTTATTATLNLRNNVIVNTSTPAGTGLTVAFRRSSGAANRLANYASTSNNNLFYAGNPAGNRLIYSDGTSTGQTLAAYKAGAFTAGTIAPRDAASVTENPTFISTQGNNAGFLHIDATVATQIESGAQNIATYTTDYDTDIRQGNGGYLGTGTAPDIGADEFNGIPLDLVPPTITYTPLNNSSCLTSDTLFATITDGTGVNITTGTKPRIWYKKTTNQNALPGNNTNTTDGWKYVEAVNASNPYILPINYSLIFGGVASGDTIQYFVVAQDIVTPTPNIAINNGIFSTAPASVALAVSSFPVTGTINKYRIQSGITGAVTVGTGGTYPTLTGTGGLFESINNSGLSGNVTATILGNITENGAVALNSISYGCASHYTLTIKPAPSTTPVLSGSSAGAIIKLNGADYVTIDGSNSGTTSRDLTVSNTNTGTSSAVIWLGNASATDGAEYNTIKNVNITGNAPTTTLGAIVSSSGSSLGAVPTTNNAHNTYQNNNINAVAYGIAVVGASTGDSATVIVGNTIGSATPANKIGYRAMFISNQTNVNASQNTIMGVTTSGTSTMSGIAVVGAISGGRISSNKISDIKNTNGIGYGANGILLNASSTPSNLTIDNNMIWDVTGQGYELGTAPADNGYGIVVDGGSGYNVYYNTVHMNTNQANDGLPAAFNVTSNITASGALNVRNNIFVNTQSTGVNRYSVICDAPNTVFTDIDYNVYFTDTAPNLGYFGNDAATFAAWQTATGKDVHSLNVAPEFVSLTDLHLIPDSNCVIDRKGIPIAGITTDIDNTTRDANHPDIGADEFSNTSLVLSSSLTPPSICSGATFTYAPTSTVQGATFTWVRDTITGITELGTVGTDSISEALTNTTNATINVIYEYTISANGCSGVQNVTVNVAPPVSLSSSLTPPGICSGSIFSYNPTSNTPGASFSWSRAAVSGISNAAATGNGNVTETLNNTTLVPVTVTYVYTITSNACSGSQTQNVQVTVSPIPSLSSSLSPTTCSGTVFSYTATSTTPGVSYIWNRAAVGGIAEPGTSGTANINEVLTNTTTSPLTVNYLYNLNSSGCTGNSQTVVVTVYPLPTVSFAPFADSVCLQSPAITLTGGSPTGGVYAGPGVANGTFTPSVAGLGQKTISYTVTANGCSNAATQPLNVIVCTGIEETEEQTVVIYPNPTATTFNIAITNGNISELMIVITDMQGKEIYTIQEKGVPANYSKQIDVSGFAKGIYYLKLNTGNAPQVHKLVIQ